MNWTILTDNRCDDSRLLTEHGLAVYVETSRHKLLLDTGASDVFLRNAEHLGIDLAAVDYVFVSHGHSDHAGGLATFLRMNSKAQVILSPHCLDRSFYSSRNGLHSITADWTAVDRSRLAFISTTTQIKDDLWAIVPERDRYPLPAANRHLLAGASADALVPDDFCHELALYADGLLFTGCAHSGLENILASVPDLPLHTVLGGFHLLDGYENEEELLRIANHLKSAWPDVQFYTGHCTGNNALQAMQQVLGKQIQGFSVGQAITAHRTIRLAEPSDMPAIMQVMDAAKQIMRSSGNLHQWVNGYPSEAVIAADMEQHVGYVIEDYGRIIAYFAFLPAPEPTYEKIYDGAWMNNEPYYVIHRLASWPDVHGVWNSVLEWAFERTHTLRVDTHRDNHIMQHNILKHGFTYCGIIYLLSGDERLAYQKTI